MSKWIDRVNEHPVLGEIGSLGIAIDQARGRETTDVFVVDGLERIRTVWIFCEKRFSSCDPFLTDPRSLNALASALLQTRTEIEAYGLDGNSNHIDAANTRADDVLAAVQAILAPANADDLTVINESISSYRSTLQKYLQEALEGHIKLNAATDLNEIKIAAQEALLNTEQQRLATLVLDFQTQFSTAQDNRARDFSAVLTDQQTKYATTAADQLTQFAKDQGQRNTNYAEAQLSNQEKFTTLIGEYTQKLKDQEREFTEKLNAQATIHEKNLETLRTGYVDSAEIVLGEITKQKNEVQKLLGVIGNVGIAHGYQKEANLARIMVYVWQFLTIAALGTLINIAYLIAFPSIEKPIASTVSTPQAAPFAATSPLPNSLNKSGPAMTSVATIQASPAPISDSAFYQAFVSRIFLSIAVGIFAAYASRQASHFLEKERKNRKSALELEALGPYIATLDKDKQDEFRLKIGDRSFGVADKDPIKPKSADPVTSFEVLNPKELADFVVSVVKGMKSS